MSSSSCLHTRMSNNSSSSRSPKAIKLASKARTRGILRFDPIIYTRHMFPSSNTTCGTNLISSCQEGGGSCGAISGSNTCSNVLNGENNDDEEDSSTSMVSAASLTEFTNKSSSRAKCRKRSYYTCCSSIDDTISSQRSLLGDINDNFTSLISLNEEYESAFASLCCCCYFNNDLYTSQEVVQQKRDDIKTIID